MVGKKSVQEKSLRSGLIQGAGRPCHASSHEMSATVQGDSGEQVGMGCRLRAEGVQCEMPEESY